MRRAPCDTPTQPERDRKSRTRQRRLGAENQRSSGRCAQRNARRRGARRGRGATIRHRVTSVSRSPPTRDAPTRPLRRRASPHASRTWILVVHAAAKTWKMMRRCAQSQPPRRRRDRRELCDAEEASPPQRPRGVALSSLPPLREHAPQSAWDLCASPFASPAPRLRAERRWRRRPVEPSRRDDRSNVSLVATRVLETSAATARA